MKKVTLSLNGKLVLTLEVEKFTEQAVRVAVLNHLEHITKEEYSLKGEEIQDIQKGYYKITRQIMSQRENKKFFLETILLNEEDKTLPEYLNLSLELLSSEEKLKLQQEPPKEIFLRKKEKEKYHEFLLEQKQKQQEEERQNREREEYQKRVEEIEGKTNPELVASAPKEQKDKDEVIKKSQTPSDNVISKETEIKSKSGGLVAGLRKSFSSLSTLSIFNKGKKPKSTRTSPELDTKERQKNKMIVDDSERKKSSPAVLFGRQFH